MQERRLRPKALPGAGAEGQTEELQILSAESVLALSHSRLFCHMPDLRLKRHHIHSDLDPIIREFVIVRVVYLLESTLLS